MDRIKGLREYTRSNKYRDALALPMEAQESYVLLAQGEYNINYSFTHPVSGEKLLLRINTGSQMHLEDQIGYEAEALKLLEGSGRTPKVLFADGSKELIDYGILVMEFLPGGSIDYRNDEDMRGVVACLSDIHAMQMPKENSLIAPGDLLQAMLDECEDMFKVYANSELADDVVKSRIRRLLDAGHVMKKKANLSSPYLCCINTELNSTNFLADKENGHVYLIDWEKPLYGDPAQDLGHLLTPTTTFWKTDIVYAGDEVDRILEMYVDAVNGRFNTEGLIERSKVWLTITCLRGLTWCAMAWIEYQDPDKLIANESTRLKLEAYLDDAMLSDIESRFGINN